MEYTFTVLIHFMVPHSTPKLVAPFARSLRTHDILWGKRWSWLAHPLETMAWHHPQMEGEETCPRVGMGMGMGVEGNGNPEVHTGM